MCSCLAVSNDCLCILAVWLDELILERLLDLPEDVAVAHVFENELALFGACQAHILFQIFTMTESAAIALLKGVVHSLTKLLIFKCPNKRSNLSELEPQTKKTPNAR